jgi:hypothetical protein
LKHRGNFEEFLMLRLTRIADADQTPTIKLEGKLLEPWVDEVRNACAAGTDLTNRIGLDLSALTFVDAAGERLLRDLIGRGNDVVACSGFVAELLRSSTSGQKPGFAWRIRDRELDPVEES